MKRLTIAIPTYHRPVELVRLLKIISSEIEINQLTDSVEVLVRDNSLNSDTERVISSLEYSDLPWLKYRKNETNVGFDMNVLNLYSEAKGDYVWLVGDDDLIFKDSISKVLELLHLEADIIHLPFRQPEELMSPQYQKSPRIKYWDSTEDAVEQILKYIKITSFVFKKSNIKIQKEVLAEKFSQSGWMHLILGLEILACSRQIKTVTLSEFFAGSIDNEWKTLNWIPAAFLTGEKLYQHRIFEKPEAKRPLKKFDIGMYIGGIQLTLLITSGVLSTKLPLQDFFDFGASYPFKKHLLIKPISLLKFMIIRLRIGLLFGGLIKSYERIKLAVKSY